MYICSLRIKAIAAPGPITYFLLPLQSELFMIIQVEEAGTSQEVYQSASLYKPLSDCFTASRAGMAKFSAQHRNDVQVAGDGGGIPHGWSELLKVHTPAIQCAFSAKGTTAMRAQLDSTTISRFLSFSSFCKSSLCVLSYALMSLT
jgi:hypothetical protein